MTGDIIHPFVLFLRFAYIYSSGLRVVVAQHQVFQLCSCRIFAGHWASAVTPAGLEWVGIQNVGIKMADFDVSHTTIHQGCFHVCLNMLDLEYNWILRAVYRWWL